MFKAAILIRVTGELFLEPQDKLYGGETILICGDGEMKGRKKKFKTGSWPSDFHFVFISRIRLPFIFHY